MREINDRATAPSARNPRRTHHHHSGCPGQCRPASKRGPLADDLRSAARRQFQSNGL